MLGLKLHPGPEVVERTFCAGKLGCDRPTLTTTRSSILTLPLFCSRRHSPSATSFTPSRSFSCCILCAVGRRQEAYIPQPLSKWLLLRSRCDLLQEYFYKLSQALVSAIASRTEYRMLCKLPNELRDYRSDHHRLRPPPMLSALSRYYASKCKHGRLE